MENLRKIWELIEEHEITPERIIFNGMEITFNPYLFHQCYAHGSISEQELLKMITLS